MNVSAINCTPIKPQSFKGKSDDDYQRIMDQSMVVMDTFSGEKQGKKSILGTAISVAMAGIIIYTLGACGINKLGKMAKEAMPKLTEAMSNKTKQGAATIIGKAQNVLLKHNGKIARTASNMLNGIAEKATVNNVAGITSVVAFLPQILKADGNGDGIKDITQKNVNAYRSALNEMGVVSDLVKLLS